MRMFDLPLMMVNSLVDKRQVIKAYLTFLT